MFGLPSGRVITFKGPNRLTSIPLDVKGCERAATAAASVQQPDSDRADDEVKEDGELMPLLSAFLQEHTPQTIAQAAIDKMISRGVMHDDLFWRHVAILPRAAGDGCWTLEPILIDPVCSPHRRHVSRRRRRLW